MDRRKFLTLAGAGAGAVLLGVDLWGDRRTIAAIGAGPGPYGDLLPADANGIQLPQGFTSRVVAQTGLAVASSNYVWHSSPDGGACFAYPSGGWVYTSNSEVGGGAGGASALRFDAAGTVVDAYQILHGTSRNCAGGATPWGTWLSCEEQVTLGPDHGWVHQVPAIPGTGLASHRLDPLGRFNHEAAVVDPDTFIVYMTEDRIDGLFYRFVPERKGPITPASKGLLQALAFADPDRRADARNWDRVDWTVGESPRPVAWVTLDNVAEAS